MTAQNSLQVGGILGIYLAAGKSSRMGCHKLSLLVEGTPLGSIAMQTALRSELDGVLVVTREDDQLDWITPALQSTPLREKWRHLPCVDASKGQAHSLRCGLQGAQEAKARAVLILLADQPFVSETMLNQLIQTFRQHEGDSLTLDYVSSSYHGMPRPPILFPCRLTPLLLTLRGDEGARRLVRNNGSLSGACIEFAHVNLFLDVDTASDYEAIQSQTKTP
jgi:molybdenum cofactor cytidylyltransferase